MPDDVLTVLFSLLDPIAEAQEYFLLALEQRYGLPVGSLPKIDTPQRDGVGDLLLCLFNSVLPVS